MSAQTQSVLPDPPNSKLLTQLITAFARKLHKKQQHQYLTIISAIVRAPSNGTKPLEKARELDRLPNIPETEKLISDSELQESTKWAYPYWKESMAVRFDEWRMSSKSKQMKMPLIESLPRNTVWMRKDLVKHVCDFFDTIAQCDAATFGDLSEFVKKECFTKVSDEVNKNGENKIITIDVYDKLGRDKTEGSVAEYTLNRLCNSNSPHSMRMPWYRALSSYVEKVYSKNDEKEKKNKGKIGIVPLPLDVANAVVSSIVNILLATDHFVYRYARGTTSTLGKVHFRPDTPKDPKDFRPNVHVPKDLKDLRTTDPRLDINNGSEASKARARTLLKLSREIYKLFLESREKRFKPNTKQAVRDKTSVSVGITANGSSYLADPNEPIYAMSKFGMCFREALTIHSLVNYRNSDPNANLGNQISSLGESSRLKAYCAEKDSAEECILECEKNILRVAHAYVALISLLKIGDAVSTQKFKNLHLSNPVVSTNQFPSFAEAYRALNSMTMQVMGADNQLVEVNCLDVAVDDVESYLNKKKQTDDMEDARVRGNVDLTAADAESEDGEEEADESEEEADE
jgi:hypothetical protein